MKNSQKIPGKAVVIGKILLIIFCVELLIMLFFESMGSEISGLHEAFLDAILLTLFSTPFLFLWVVKAFVDSRNQFEQKLQDSQNRLLAALRVAKVGSWYLDHSNHKLTWSDEVYDIFGVEKSDLTVSYEDFLSRVHPDDKAEVDQVFTRPVKGKIPYKFEHRLLLDNGSIKYVCERAETTYDQKDNPVISSGTILDITQHIEVQRQIEDERKRAQNYLDIASVIMVALDREGRVTMVNPTCCKLIKMKKNELIGINWIDNFFVEPEKSEMKKAYKEIMAGKIQLPELHENWVKTSNDKMLLTSWHNSLIYDDQNNIEGTLSSGQDITFQREFEESLNKSKQETEEALDKLSELSLQLQTEAAQRQGVENRINQISQMDNLTQLPTRSVIKQQIIELVAKKNPDEMIGFLAIRLNGIEQINKNHGLETGDAVIVETAIRINETVGNHGLVCRSHGVRFIVILTQDVTIDEFENYILRIKNAIQEPLETHQLNTINCSITKMIYPDKQHSLDDFFN